MLSSEQDAFFKDNMYENFGDIGMNIKKMVDDFQQIAKSNQNIQTVGLYLGNLSTLVNDNFTCMNLSIYGLHLLRTLCFLLSFRGHG